jgi:16S rRNA (adenine1518-N6/adenine1519-N6)-dimethyltransferase
MLGAAAIRELLDRHGVSPSRALGQNFVIDPNTIDRIVRAAGVTTGDRVIEIGPGVGSLTVGLVAAGAYVTAIELDGHLLAPLGEVVAEMGDGRVEVVHADATVVDWSVFFGDREEGPYKLIANLPYNVAASVVLRALDEAPQITEILVMVQREVAERLAAGPGTAAYGIPSVKVRYHGAGEVVGRVPATVFHPVPKVESALVRIVRASEPATDADPEPLFALVRTAFGQRRKMLRKSLAGLVDSAGFEAAGVDPTVRPQDVDIAAWGRLSTARRSEQA